MRAEPLRAMLAIACAAMTLTLSPAAAAPKDFMISAAERRQLDSGTPLRFRFDAPSGQFRMRLLGEPVGDYVLSAQLSLNAFHANEQWPPTAYIGLYGDGSTDSLIRVTLGQSLPRSDLLAVRAELLLGGVVRGQDVIKLVKRDATVLVRMSFHDGALAISVDDADPIELDLPFDKVAPYASASSGKATVVVQRVPPGHAI